MNQEYQGEELLAASEPAAEVRKSVEEIVREGAQEILRRALEEEVEAFLQRGRYGRSDGFRGYRNGYAEERTIGTGIGAIAVRVPRVRDVPVEVAPESYRSEIVPRYKRRSEALEGLFRELYLEGLSSGDFEPVFRALLGDDAPLSSSTMLRLKNDWEAEYQAWKVRSLADHEYPYLWVDGVYIGCGQEREKSVLLCIVGAREDGTKELLSMDQGYRESTASWKDTCESLQARGLQTPQVVVGDGGLGAWAALDEVFPDAKHQRCWNHKVLNVQDKLPKRLQHLARATLRDIWEAPTRQECEVRRDRYVAKLRKAGQQPAADTVLRDWEDFITFYDFPQEHWQHLRTSNPIESVFAGVRLRTNVAKRMPKRENAVYLVFKVVQRLSQNWRALNGGRSLMTLVLAGHTFKDGILSRREVRVQAA